MLPSRIERFLCPNCRAAELTTAAAPDGQARIENGILSCTGCSDNFEIRNGIPRFVPASNYADSFGFQWNRHDVTQLDSHCGTTISKDRVFGVTQWSTDLRGETVLEAGSGAGRFTEILAATGADLFSFDYSSAVEANRRNNGHNDNLTLFQGDIFNIPLREGRFDKVFCLGVIQHTPDPHAAFKSLAKQVRPGGQLVIDVYADNLAARLQWKYLLRPITKRIDQQRLYRFIEKAVPPLVPLSGFFRKVAGRAGARLSPIVEYSHLGLSAKDNVQWAILDTFDMYSPAHDHPQSVKAVRRWFVETGFENIFVGRGRNGVIGRGTRPLV